MDRIEKEFATIKLIVSAIYATIFLYAGMVYLRMPNIPYIWGQTQRSIFYALLALVPVMFLVSFTLVKQLMDSEKLAERFQSEKDEENALNMVINITRVGSIVMAAIGESIAIYGLVLYFLSGHSTHPFIFFTLSAIHYPFTIRKINKARDDIEKLSR
jgi:hypothetical protein